MNYEELAAQGRLLVLPVPLGGTLWRVRTQRLTRCKGPGAFVSKIKLTPYNFFAIVCGDDFGNTVFLTEEEATKRQQEILAEMRAR